MAPKIPLLFFCDRSQPRQTPKEPPRKGTKMAPKKHFCVNVLINKLVNFMPSSLILCQACRFYSGTAIFIAQQPTKT
jgi:hypothetical protein